MKVLIGCEESQAVCKAFRAKGHEAYSCDIQPCSGGHPEWHIHGDVFEAIDRIKPYMFIGFPPCTHLANAGGCHFEKKRNDGRQRQGLEFFLKLWNAPIDKIALENPIGIIGSCNYISKHFPDMVQCGLPMRPTQVIQPFYFGDSVRKYTCLWLKNIPPLIWSKEDNLFSYKTSVAPAEPTKTIVRKGKYRHGTERKLYWYDSISSKNGSKVKSKTFPGIAAAMAEQWS